MFEHGSGSRPSARGRSCGRVLPKPRGGDGSCRGRRLAIAPPTVTSRVRRGRHQPRCSIRCWISLTAAGLQRRTPVSALSSSNQSRLRRSTNVLRSGREAAIAIASSIARGRMGPPIRATPSPVKPRYVLLQPRVAAPTSNDKLHSTVAAQMITRQNSDDEARSVSERRHHGSS